MTIMRVTAKPVRVPFIFQQYNSRDIYSEKIKYSRFGVS